MYEEVRKMLEEAVKDVSRIRGISREEYLRELYDRIQEKPGRAGYTDDGVDLFVLVMIIVYLAIIIGAWIYAAYHGVITI